MAEDLPSTFYDRLRRRMEKNVISKAAFNKGCWLWAGPMKSNSTWDMFLKPAKRRQNEGQCTQSILYCI